jgi:hypothetical protein
MNSSSSYTRFLLWVVFACYLVPLLLVLGSLSVPPADLPLCILMFFVAAVGLVLAWRATRIWRLIWLGALAASVLLGALEIIAGRRLAHRHAAGASSAPPNLALQATPGLVPVFFLAQRPGAPELRC